MKHFSWVIYAVVACLVALPSGASVGDCEAAGASGRCTLALASGGQPVTVQRLRPGGSQDWQTVVSTAFTVVTLEGGALYRVCRRGGTHCDVEGHWVPFLPQGVEQIPARVRLGAGPNDSALISKNLSYAEQVYQYNAALAAQLVMSVDDCESLPAMAPPVVDLFAHGSRRSWEHALWQALKPLPALQEAAQLSRHAAFQEYEGCRRGLPDWF